MNVLTGLDRYERNLVCSLRIDTEAEVAIGGGVAELMTDLSAANHVQRLQSLTNIIIHVSNG